jgi:hypothetical protein
MGSARGEVGPGWQVWLWTWLIYIIQCVFLHVLNLELTNFIVDIFEHAFQVNMDKQMWWDKHNRSTKTKYLKSRFVMEDIHLCFDDILWRISSLGDVTPVVNSEIFDIKDNLVM